MVALRVGVCRNERPKTLFARLDLSFPEPSKSPESLRADRLDVVFCAAEGPELFLLLPRKHSQGGVRIGRFVGTDVAGPKMHTVLPAMSSRSCELKSSPPLIAGEPTASRKSPLAASTNRGGLTISESWAVVPRKGVAKPWTRL